VKNSISLLILCFLGVGNAYAQVFQPISVDAKLACFGGNLSVEVLITSRDSLQVQGGTLVPVDDSNYLVKDIAAGDVIQIRQVTPTQTRLTNFLVPVIEPEPVLPPIVSRSTICGNGGTAILRALVMEGQTVDWYDAPTGGSKLATGTPELTVAKAGNYYAESRSTTLTCLSANRERSVGVVTSTKSLCPQVWVTRRPSGRIY
jgi:hypothetical protein